MKATIEFDPQLYRRLKAEAALRGRTVRDMVAEGVRHVLAAPAQPARVAEATPAYFASLKEFADNAQGAHDLASVRASIDAARGSDGPR